MTRHGGCTDYILVCRYCMHRNRLLGRRAGQLYRQVLPLQKFKISLNRRNGIWITKCSKIFLECLIMTETNVENQTQFHQISLLNSIKFPWTEESFFNSGNTDTQYRIMSDDKKQERARLIIELLHGAAIQLIIPYMMSPSHKISNKLHAIFTV